jgi:hypothetical protein
MSKHESAPIEVLVGSQEQLHDLISDAEAALLPAATKERSAGILVTRHSPGRYTVALSDTVPFGETREHARG